MNFPGSFGARWNEGVRPSWGEAMDGGFEESVDFSRDSPEPSRVAEPEDGKVEEKTRVEETREEELNEPGEADEPFIPERIKKALEGAKTFEEYRKARAFRFLHLYSGPRDILAREVQAAAEKARLRVETLSLDKKKDPMIDLGAVQTHEVLREEVRNGEWDATHSGFPCGSFSRVRHKAAPGMPGPVRDASNIYGYPGNGPREQAEADRGTMMAVQSGWLMEEQVESCRRRKVPPTSTLENPPGDDQVGSAWHLPEIKLSLKKSNSSIAQFNTCSFQTKQKTRWYKPGQFAGRLEGLDKLARVCRCPAWVKHDALLGKAKTEEAGEYPDELAALVAQLIVDVWKRVVNLEFLRYQLSIKKENISTLQAKWVENENKRTRNLEGKRTIHMALVPGNLDVDVIPEANLKSTKKQRKGEEDWNCLGGMRNPQSAVERMHLLKETGIKMRKAWHNMAVKNLKVLEVAKNYGSDGAELDEELVQLWRKQLGALFEVKEPTNEGVVLKENTAFKSPLNEMLWNGWGRMARDPDTELVNFIRDGAPLGMAVEIPSSQGIFPSVVDGDEDTDRDDGVEFDIVRGMLNYKSVTDQPEEARIEIERNIEKGFVIRMSWEEATRRFGAGTCSKLALILKEKPDGTTKRRLILDMKRSGGNDRACIKERIVLPRLADIVSMLRDLHSKKPQLAKNIAGSGVPHHEAKEQADETEFILVDLADAFCHFAVDSRELKHCVTPDENSEGCLVWVAMLFGFRGAPLVMGRLSSAIGRLLTSLMADFEGQMQIYVDDLAIALQGPQQHRNYILACLLYTLAAFGVQTSLKKGERGRRVQWIGAMMEVWHHQVTLALPRKLKDDLIEVMTEWLTKGMIPLKELRVVTGRLSWAAGVVPRMRWIASSFYAVIAAVEADERLGIEADRAKKRDKDRREKTGLVHVKRLGAALQWILKLLAQEDRCLVRHEPLEVLPPNAGIITDASPKGVGALFVVVRGEQLVIQEAFEAKFTLAEARMLKVEWGEASSQSVVEAYAFLRALKKWGHLLKKQDLLIKSDSTVALHMARKLSSPTMQLNFVAAELSLLLEEIQTPRIVVHHVPGVFNKETDWLSRMHDRGERPTSLEKVKIVTLAEPKEDFFKIPPPGTVRSEGETSPAHQSSVWDCLG